MGVYLGEPLEKEDWLGEHIADFVNESTERNKGRVAFSVVLPSGHHASLKYEELELYSDALAVCLREHWGLKRGDVVAIQSVNTLAYPVVVFAILKAGLTVTNINPLYTSDETQHQLKDSGAKILFAIDVFGDRLAASTKGTNVEKLIALSLVDFFENPTRAFLSFILKHVKKTVPRPSRPFDVRFDQLIKIGLKYLAQGIDIAQYRAEASPEDIAFYQYTGGTTGRSKGAELTHRNVVANISQGHKRNKTALQGQHEVMALVLPLYHVYALAVGAMASMHHGHHTVLVPVPRPVSNLKVVFQHFDITTMPGVNTLYQALLKEDWFKAAPPKHLYHCYAGAAPLQPTTAQEWEKLVGSSIYEGYGLTEATCVVSSSPLNEPPRRGTCGKPLPGTEIRIVGDNGDDLPFGERGELWVRGPQVMKGYLNNPKATAETVTPDGWLKTGDVAILNADGYLSIVDRMKDMVIVSGFNVYPTDIEDVLTRYEDVMDAAVVGIPSQETGEKLIAYVVPGHGGVTQESVIAHCRAHLTGYKIPKIVVFVTEMPKSPVGKVLRRELRAEALKQFSEKGV